MLGKLRGKYPKLSLYLREDLTDRLIERLQSGELDAVLLALPYDLGATRGRGAVRRPVRVLLSARPCAGQHARRAE